METLTANITSRPRKAQLGGRSYLVANLSMIVPGILNGSKGALYYSLQEIQRNPKAWNHMPIVLNHSYKAGQPVSARDSEILDKQQLGIVLNARVDGKLIAEGWFDIEATERVAPEVLLSLNTNTQVELSTGLFSDTVEAPADATFNGDPYTHSAINYRPDHLAILPDAKGACSINDGCGVLVNEDADPIINEKAFSNLHWLGSSTLTDNHMHSIRVNDSGNGFTNVEDDHSHVIVAGVVQSAGGHTHAYTKSGLMDTAINNSEKETSSMALNEAEKKTLVDDLITNCECWEESEREFLNNSKDEKLMKLVGISKETRKTQESLITANAEIETLQEAATAPAPKPKKEELVVNEIKPQTTEDWMKSAPVEIQSAVQNAMRIEAEEKTAIVTQMVANASDLDKPALIENLNSKPLEDLRILSKLSPKVAAPTQPVINYSGQAVPSFEQLNLNRDYDAEEDVLEPMSL